MRRLKTMHQGAWKIKPLFLCHAAIALLLLSLFLPACKPLWEGIDTAVFHFTNASLKENPAWQTFWAFGNHKIADWLQDLCIIAFWVVYIRSLPKADRSRGMAQMAFSFLLTALVILCLNRLLFRETLEYLRDSPTRIFDGSVRLSQELPWIRVKDDSVKSFPSDHATFALMFALTYSFFTPRRFGIIACFYACIVSLPRLMAGAHWLSDIVVGSGSIILFVTAWIFCTPIHGWIINRLEAILKKYGKRQLHKAS